MDLTNVSYAIIEVWNDGIQDIKFASSKEEAQLKANLMFLDFLLYEEMIDKEDFHKMVEKAKSGDLPKGECEIDDCDACFSQIEDDGTVCGAYVDWKAYYTEIINVENQNQRWTDERLDIDKAKEENKDEQGN